MERLASEHDEHQHQTHGGETRTRRVARGGTGAEDARDLRARAAQSDGTSKGGPQARRLGRVSQICQRERGGAVEDFPPRTRPRQSPPFYIYRPIHPCFLMPDDCLPDSRMETAIWTPTSCEPPLPKPVCPVPSRTDSRATMCIF